MFKKLASFAGKALKKVGEIGSAALKPVGALAASGVVQNLAGKAIDMLPVPGIAKDIAKGAVGKAAEFVTSGRAAALLDKAKATGQRLENMGE